MRRIFVTLLIVKILLFSMFSVVDSFAQKKHNKKEWESGLRLNKPTGEPRYQILNINNLWTWVKSNGESNHSPDDDSGLYYPRGKCWVIYKDGIKWGGKCYLDAGYSQPAPYNQTIRVGGNDYGNGTDLGRIAGFGATAEAVNESDPDVRMYRIRRDYASMSEEALIRDAAESLETFELKVTYSDMQAIYDQYEKDWNEWPVEQGAPFIDRNGNGVYDPPPAFSETFTVDSLIPGNYDEPGIAGGDLRSPADQVLWNVFNDLDETKTLALEGSYPMGLEIQRTVWGYNREDALGDIFFKRIRMINKGGVDIDHEGTKGVFYIDSMYVGQWSDPDIGAFSDDLVGCDTLLNMGFSYSGNSTDREFSSRGLAPPAVGYVLLQGPLVYSPESRAIFNFKIKQDIKNLSMTSFTFSRPSLFHPPSDYEGGLEWYQRLRGYQPLAYRSIYHPFPPGMKPGPFPLSGDPITGKGFLDGLGEAYSFAPGDRRLMISSGPFCMAPGDTQEVIIGVVCGMGADNISSVAVMKFNALYTRNLSDWLFSIPKITSPCVTVTEMDEKVILEWGSDDKRVEETEMTIHEAGSYVFEGYNVYQFPKKNSSPKEGERIATFDLPTDPTVIMDDYIDSTTGYVFQKPVQFGSNSGIRRYFEFNRDYIRDIDKIYNGQEYYLAVTAYSRRTILSYLPAALESDPEIFTVVPRVPFGVAYQTQYGDTLSVVHLFGQGEGDVYPIVVDPTQSTGDAYEAGFDSDGDTTTWYLMNLTDDRIVLSGQRNLSGDDDYPMIDGILVKVVGPNTVEDVYRYTSPQPESGRDKERFSADKVGVYPNPYYAYNPAEVHRFARFVTFNNLPSRATIRLFNLAGQLVMKLDKDNPSQFQRWDLLNHDGIPVASGMYIAYVEMELPSGGKAVKVLKLVIIQEQEVLDVY